jgi:hypothetical protein
MKYYHIFFVTLRLLVLLQLILVIFKQAVITPEIKIIIDSILKLSIGLFVILFFQFHNIGLDPWDIYVLQFSGLVIMADIDYGGLLKIIGHGYPALASDLSFLKNIQRYPVNK